ncbi:hypothetical protein, partial [Bacillus sp. ISL-55]|uniref:hypothetical protein n=1 Tax=Bacillus sp. ISL-55 TaxID=2819134 RepID=UPI001BEC87CD
VGRRRAHERTAVMAVLFFVFRFINDAGNSAATEYMPRTSDRFGGKANESVRKRIDFGQD